MVVVVVMMMLSSFQNFLTQLRPQLSPCWSNKERHLKGRPPPRQHGNTHQHGIKKKREEAHRAAKPVLAFRVPAHRVAHNSTFSVKDKAQGLEKRSTKQGRRHRTGADTENFNSPSRMGMCGLCSSSRPHGPAGRNHDHGDKREPAKLLVPIAHRSDWKACAGTGRLPELGETPTKTNNNKSIFHQMTDDLRRPPLRPLLTRPHFRQVKVPLRSSGLTSVERVTVPLTLTRRPMRLVLSWRTRSTRDRLKKLT